MMLTTVLPRLQISANARDKRIDVVGVKLSLSGKCREIVSFIIVTIALDFRASCFDHLFSTHGLRCLPSYYCFMLFNERKRWFAFVSSIEGA